MNQVHVGVAAITGTVGLLGLISAGSTFEAIATLPNGSTVTAPLNGVGSFSLWN